ncbi:MAG: hypothetical protein K9I82_01425 [Chitinophagaceae bacterium]|nr:hypothetical protein [Chitinophagaceae bacterium]
MELRKVIKTTLRKYLNEEQILKEYVTRDIVYLKDYFKMPDSTKIEYLPYEHYGYFRDFLEETDTDFEEPSEYTDVDGEDVFMFEDDMELITWLEKNNKELFTEFGEYLFEKIKNNNLPIPDADYPAWSFFDNTPELIKNQWLIHFTKDAYGIAENGFKYGVDDMSKLGLTTHLSEFDKKYGGYNFAYTLGDFEKYGRSSGWHGSKYKYGDEAVVFNASGIKVWHYGDGEPQVIFYGNTAKNIIPIRVNYDSEFYVQNKKGRVVYKNEKLPKVVDWIKNNYQQYRKNFVF